MLEISAPMTLADENDLFKTVARANAALADCKDVEPACLVFVAPDQSAFLDDMDGLSAALSGLGVPAGQVLCVAVPPAVLTETGVRHTLRLVCAEGRRAVHLFIWNKSSLTAYRFHVSDKDAARVGIGDPLSDLMGLMATGQAGSLPLPSTERFHRVGNVLTLPETQPVTVTHMGAALGSSCPLADVPKEILSGDNATLLDVMGVRDYHKSSLGPMRLAIAALDDLMTRYDHPGRIARVIVTSHSMDDPAFAELGRALQHHGITDRAELIYGARCASAISTLRVAVGDMLCGQDGATLVLMADAVRNEVTGRTLNNGMSLFSDGATALIVERAHNGLCIARLIETCRHDMARLKPADDFVGYIKAFGSGLRDTVADFRNAGDKQIAPAAVLTGNYNLSIMRNYCILSGLPANALYKSELAAHSHLFSSDLLLNACSLAHGQGPGSQAPVLLLGTGSYHWGVAELRLTGRPLAPTGIFSHSSAGTEHASVAPSKAQI